MTTIFYDQWFINKQDRIFSGDPKPEIIIFTYGEGFIKPAYIIQKSSTEQ